MTILCIDNFERETVGIRFLLATESAQSQIGDADAKIRAAFIVAQHSEENTQDDPAAKLAKMITVSEVP